MCHSTVSTAGTQVVYVGLDYATTVVQVCVLDRSGKLLANRACANDGREIAQLVSRFGQRVQGAIEACTGASDLAEELLQRAGWSIHLAHPGYVHRMKQNPDKSDFTDARMLAELVRVGFLPRVWLAPQTIRELRRLVRHRQDLVNRRRAVKLQVGALLRDHRVVAPPGGSWTKRWRSWLGLQALPSETRWVIDERCHEFDELVGRIARAEARLAQVTASDVVVQRLLDLRGVGLVTACLIRAEIGDVTRFRTGKQLARYCGLTPRNASSGLRIADAGLIRAGNRHLRAGVIETGHRLIRFDEGWKAFAAELESRGKKRCVVVAAVANRWMRRLFHELMNIARAA